MTDDQRYMFKAPFKLRDKKSLLKLLKRRDLNGEGGVFFDDVNESLPKAEKIVQSLTGDGKIIQVSFLSTRPKPAYGRQGLEWDRRVRIQLRRLHFGVDTFGRIFIFGKQYP